MKFENTETWGFEHALRGMRNPKNSWDKSDSYFNITDDYDEGVLMQLMLGFIKIILNVMGMKILKNFLIQKINIVIG